MREPAISKMRKDKRNIDLSQKKYDKIGNLTLIREVRPRIFYYGGERKRMRMVRVKCKCGKEFVCLLQNYCHELSRGCGCVSKHGQHNRRRAINVIRYKVRYNITRLNAIQLKIMRDNLAECKLFVKNPHNVSLSSMAFSWKLRKNGTINKDYPTEGAVLFFPGGFFVTRAAVKLFLNDQQNVNEFIAKHYTKRAEEQYIINNINKYYLNR